MRITLVSFFTAFCLMYSSLALACMGGHGDYNEKEAEVLARYAAYIGRTEVVNVEELDLDEDNDGINDFPGELIGPNVTFKLLDLPKEIDRLSQDTIVVRFGGGSCERNGDYKVKRDVFFLKSGHWRRANQMEFFLVKTYLEKQGQKDW